MKIEISTAPTQNDVEFVIAQVRGHNAQFTVKDFSPLACFLRDESGKILGGVTGRAYWGWLHIEFLWVATALRANGYGKSLLLSAESEGKKLGCKNANVDTFSFQAKGFYENLGYEVFGTLEGYSGKHERYFLRKEL